MNAFYFFISVLCILAVCLLIVYVALSSREQKEFRSKLTYGDRCTVHFGEGSYQGRVHGFDGDEVLVIVRRPLHTITEPMKTV